MKRGLSTFFAIFLSLGLIFGLVPISYAAEVFDDADLQEQASEAEVDADTVGILDTGASIGVEVTGDGAALVADVASASVTPAVSTTVHVQDYGWLDPVVSDVTAGGALGTEAFAGTEGESKRVEAFEMELGLAGTAYAGTDSHISYNTHIQNQGWQQPVWSDPATWVADGAQSGTTGSGLRCEAIQIALTGDIAAHYDVYYRVHVQDYGWLCWAKDGEVAGTAGYAKRMEAVQVVLVAKGGTPPADPGGAVGPYLRESLVSYTAHVQDYGWLDPVADGEEAGTTGEGLRVEALTVALANQDHPGSIAYNAHVQNVGWQCDTEDASIWFSDGQEVGTDGQSLRVEAMQIALTGEMADHYDVYYRVHAQNIGWLGWAKDGQEAGTAGLALRLEAVEVVLVEKGGEAPGSTARPYVEGADYYEGSGIVGWSTLNNPVQTTEDVGCLDTLGSESDNRALTGLSLDLTNDIPTGLEGSISYSLHIANYGWTGWMSCENGIWSYEGDDDGDPTLTIDESNGYLGSAHGEQVEAVQIELDGEIASFYDVYYRGHVDNNGWLGWAANGEVAGSAGRALAMHGLQVCLRMKAAGAPGTTARHDVSLFRIYLDAGHGYNNTGNGLFDYGASGDGYNEYDLNVELVDMVAEYVQNHYELELVTNTDGGYYKARHAEAVTNGCDALVSIHFNSYNSAATGTESYIHAYNAAEGSQTLQNIVHERLIRGTGLKNRGEKTAEYAIISGPLPATLLEVAFIDNASDMAWYQSRKSDVAEQIAIGLYEVSCNL